MTIFCKTIARAVLFTGMLSAAPAVAAEYPSRDFTFVVHGSAGGGSDIIARTVTNIIAQKKLIPTKIIVENRPGGSGVIAYTYLAARKDNPYYLGTMSGSFFTTALSGDSTVSYEDFTPLAAIAEDPYVMVVSASSGIESVKDLVAKGHANFGATGVLTDHALLARMFQDKTGLKASVVPYGGDGEVLAALLGGHIDVQFGNPSEVLEQIKAGRLVPLAMTTTERVSVLPDVPTLKEQNVDIELGQLRAFVMPKGLKPADVAYMQNVFKQVADSPEWKAQYLDKNNANAVFLDSAALGERFKELNDMYRGFMKEMGLLKKQ
ncbi:putative tricarboxylic transport membrane protein [Ancylobacter aquaticus]|uniref:Putative tricarboxylic transport membrane protein n=1 Tax=Ancylobacter aquaticus TaxID=100 RepID=A0A4R1HCE7_ANCAQ|nr:tripartite tricarboxylate transporter substrate binding protein [Ancylobacter aquaticus]TCK19687.1 putative tricarboxylic transport membrane protein [Ancylobacter aquaticus]